MIFACLLENIFLDYNCKFVYHWIGLSFRHKVLNAWYFKLSCWIGKKIYVERDKCFTWSALYFRVLSSCLYCTNWEFVLIWLFVIRFIAPWFLSLHWETFHIKQTVSLFSLISILDSIIYRCCSEILTSLEKFLLLY